MVAVVIESVEKCLLTGSLEVGDYLKAVEDLCTMHLGYKDVQMLLFKPQHNVLINLVGLHYCMYRLGVPVFYFFGLAFYWFITLYWYKFCLVFVHVNIC